MPYPMYPTYPQYYPTYPPAALPMQQTTMQQPASTAPQPTMQPPSPTSLIWVSSDRDAAMYPVGPNNAVALWNQNEPVAYLKQADASGRPTMKTYDLVERVEQGADAPKTDAANNIPYAMKSDLASIIEAIGALNEAFKSIKGDMEQMSRDLYGLSGPNAKAKADKKPAKKADAEEDSE